jgi:hypothetical protein
MEKASPFFPGEPASVTLTVKVTMAPVSSLPVPVNFAVPPVRVLCPMEVEVT